MAKEYIFVRMPKEIYNQYKNVKIKMETDISKFVGRKIPLTMPKVFKAVISPNFNKNFIEIDMHKLVTLAREKKR